MAGAVVGSTRSTAWELPDGRSGIQPRYPRNRQSVSASNSSRKLACGSADIVELGQYPQVLSYFRSTENNCSPAPDQCHPCRASVARGTDGPLDEFPIWDPLLVFHSWRRHQRCDDESRTENSDPLGPEERLSFGRKLQLYGGVAAKRVAGSRGKDRFDAPRD